MRKAYKSDLSDAEWGCLEPHLPAPEGNGRPGARGDERGYDGAKKVKGRKRHLLVDTEGLVLVTKVHSANITDRDGIKLLLDLSARDPEAVSRQCVGARKVAHEPSYTHR